MPSTSHQPLREEVEQEHAGEQEEGHDHHGSIGYSQVHAHAHADATHAARGWTQLRVFGRKNATLALRNWKASLGQLLSPIVIVVLLFGMISRE